MGTLYYLSFRDIASASTGVTAGEVYALDGVDPATAWPPQGLTGADWVSWDKVADLFRHKRVCFVVHGFNVDVDHGVKVGGPLSQQFEALGDMGLAMTGADMVVTVLWPGDGLIGWSWFTAFGHAMTTGQMFRNFLISPDFTASQVSFISHSLGARVVLETITQTLATPYKIDFDTAVLAAAAVDDTALDTPYANAVASLRRLVVLSSSMDEVLKIFFTAGDFVESALWSNYDGDTRALGRYGPAFAPGSLGPARTEWYDIRPSVGQGHEDYVPAGWLAADPLPNGWSDKRREAATFYRDVYDARPFLPDLPDWATDNTPRFRPGWPPKF